MGQGHLKGRQQRSHSSWVYDKSPIKSKSSSSATELGSLLLKYLTGKHSEGGGESDTWEKISDHL